MSGIEDMNFTILNTKTTFYIDWDIESKLDFFFRKLVPFQNLTETIVQEIRKFLEVQPVLVLVSKPSLFGSGTSTFDVQRSVDMHFVWGWNIQIVIFY